MPSTRPATTSRATRRCPPTPLIHRIKHLAFSLGLGISGTGVRNDFAVPDAAKRDADVAHVTRWVDVAAKLGAPVLRVFDGKVMPAGVPKATVMDWIVDGIQRCVTAGEARGVMIVLQNHNDALKVAADYLEIRTAHPVARGSASTSTSAACARPTIRMPRSPCSRRTRTRGR